MKRLMIVLAVVVAGVVGLGFYMDWFHVGSEHTGGKNHITLTVDEERFKEDEKKAQEKVRNLGHQDKDKTGASTEPTKDATGPPAKQPQN